MYGRFGTSEFGTTEFLGLTVVGVGRRIVCLGDPSDHGGVVITTNQDGTLKASGTEVAVEGALHSCPLIGHGITPIIAVVSITYQNEKLLLTEEAYAGCGAKIIPPDRKVYIE